MSELHIKEFNNVKASSDLGQYEVAAADCIASAFGEGQITIEDAKNHMAGDQVLIAEMGRKVVGFTSTIVDSPRNIFNDPSLSDEVGVYFAGAAIAKDAQGAGTYRELNKKRFDLALENNVNTVFTRTQNPRVYDGIKGFFDSLVENGTITGYESSKVIQPGAYGQMLTSEPIASYTDSLMELNPHAGDAAIITWKFNLPKAKND